MSDPFLPPAWWLEGTNQNSIPANDNALRFLISQSNVNNATTAQPALTSPADDGKCYIIQSTHTGTQWATFTPKDLAVFYGGTWKAFSPVEGVRISVGGVSYIYTYGAWTAAGGGGVSAVVTQSGTSLNADGTNAGKYTRFTNASAKTYTFNSANTYAVGDEYHGRNVGAGNLTLTQAGSFVLNAPSGGSLIVPPGGTFTVKIVAAAEADVFGLTLP